jgi:hypothetical protein
LFFFHEGYLIRLIPVPLGEFEQLAKLTSLDESEENRDNETSEEKLKV